MDREYFTRQDFYDIVWTIPVSQLLGKYHISHHKFQQLCKKSNIPLPGIGYWIKIKNNKVTQRKPLPVDNGSQKLINLALRSENNPPKVSEDSKTSTSVARKESSAKFSVPEKLKKPHHLILETKRLWADAKANGYNYDRNIPHLSIRVEPINTKRALLLMDTFIKLLEKRGHQIEFKYYRPYAVLYEVDIELDLREAAKRIPKPGSYPTFELEYTGEFVLMTGKYSLSREWRDGKIKLEGMLEKIILWMEAHAREWADRKESSRLAQIERERQKEIQDNLLALQQQEQDYLKKLLEDAQKYDNALKLRAYITAIQSKTMHENNFELQQWIEWAFKQADMLDPLLNN